MCTPLVVKLGTPQAQNNDMNSNNVQLVVGVVFNPILDEMFSAIVGCGATCNGKPIKVSKNVTGNDQKSGV